MLGNDLSLAEQEKLTAGWKHILTNQFHDIIPGSSIFEVYEDSKKDYEWIAAQGEEVEAGFLADAVTEEASVYTVFNSNSFVRKGGSVLLLGAAGNSAYLEDGTALKSQETEGGLLVEIPEVPAMGTATVVLKKAPAEENTAFTVDGHKVETPFYLVEFNEAGQISRLYDKENDREVLAAGQCGNVLQVFEDKPMGNDAWDIEIYYQEKCASSTD